MAYTLTTIIEARAELARPQTEGAKTEDKDITLSVAFDLV